MKNFLVLTVLSLIGQDVLAATQALDLTLGEKTKCEARTAASADVAKGKGPAPSKKGKAVEAPLRLEQYPEFEREWTAAQNTLYRKALAVLHNTHDAEVAVSDASLNAMRFWNGFKGKSKRSSWLVRIAINAALMVRRAKNNRAEQARSLDEPLEDESGPNFADSVYGQIYGPMRRSYDLRDNPYKIYARAELRRIVRRAISRLSPLHRQTIRLYFIDELKISEISELLDVQEGTIKNRLFRARERLEEILQGKVLTLSQQDDIEEDEDESDPATIH